MRIVVVRVRDAANFLEFRDLLVEYELTLPIALRHGRVPDVKAVRKAYDEPNAGFTASVGNVMAGCVAVTRYDDSTATVQRLYVRSAFRERGVGRALVSGAIEFCRDRSYARVALDTEREMLPAAYRLYAALGFTDCEPYGTVAYDTPTFMELRLASALT
jgi:GNAT superfamily N-acetyltransferase